MKRRDLILIERLLFAKIYTMTVGFQDFKPGKQRSLRINEHSYLI